MLNEESRKRPKFNQARVASPELSSFRAEWADGTLLTFVLDLAAVERRDAVHEEVHAVSVRLVEQVPELQSQGRTGTVSISGATPDVAQTRVAAALVATPDNTKPHDTRVTAFNGFGSRKNNGNTHAHQVLNSSADMCASGLCEPRAPALMSPSL